MPLLEHRPLLPAPLVRPAAALAVLCVAALGALGGLVAGDSEAGAFDQAVFDLIGTPGVAGPLALATHPAAMVAVIALVAAIALRLRRPRVALLAVAAPLVAGLLNTWVLKPVFDRTHDGYLAYPSGHTTLLVSVLAVITLVVAGNARGPGPAVTAAAVSAGLVAVGAGAIVGNRFHYLTDTLGSVFWGVATVIVVAGVIDACGRSTVGGLPRADHLTR